MNTITSLTAKQLRHAAEIKEKIQSLEKQIGRILVSSSSKTVSIAPKPKRHLSAATRAKIASAAKARWAKVRARPIPIPPAK